MTIFKRFLRDESGVAAIEFALVFPMVFTIFTASFESSMFMARAVMLERGVDLTVRRIRLGIYEGMTHQALKAKICGSGILVSSSANCINNMKIWMQPVSTIDFDMPVPPQNCVDKVSDINTTEPNANEFEYGGDNDIMFMVICLKEKPMFPTTAVSVQMPWQPDNTYAIVTTAIFVNEPG
jgi:TadE-like protein